MVKDLEEIDVLVVEDDKNISELICSFLSTLSVSYKSSSDPKEILNFLDNYKFKIYVLDISLSSEFTGIDLSVIVRDKFPTAKIYALTGYSMLFDDISPKVAGFNRVFYKPVGYKEFMDTVIKDLNVL